ncbi:hypothetical protein ASL83_003479 [Vibrio parahaemolyticus]|uniref:Uncharacterized protein n=1 Tax=Vibrio jasicida TaxID=766224 RepID=A0AAU9QQ12_9VIBR|nr:hypothetical protein [Vibrio parahaemolyticus]EJO2025525.1 hypothetical protein [Vibrio parahaemolyticus]ELA8176467.1 hypothetical protein [Vibrio alginolyticus]CAH1592746.1 hypothetical protein THF1C08_320050 [Vibrio jasicida]CAH1597430.1 hypothetical protein THF1A12_320050 [Vibrio jasicida]
MTVSKIQKFITEIEQEKRKTRKVNTLFLLGLLLFELGVMVSVNYLYGLSAAINVFNFVVPLFIAITLIAIGIVWWDCRPNRTFKIKQCADGTTEVELDDVILVVDDTETKS